ncbi:MAG TPA: hypothetical protein VIS05_00890 [Ilumatobacter sp.]
MDPAKRTTDPTTGPTDGSVRLGIGHVQVAIPVDGPPVLAAHGAARFAADATRVEPIDHPGVEGS